MFAAVAEHQADLLRLVDPGDENGAVLHALVAVVDVVEPIAGLLIRHNNTSFLRADL